VVEGNNPELVQHQISAPTVVPVFVDEIPVNVVVREAQASDVQYAKIITDEMEASAKARGTGIAKRTPEYVAEKMKVGKAIIAITERGDWVGFCYIEAWGHGQFVANSGLIVSPEFRKSGIATQIKRRTFNLSRSKFPKAKIFGLTTGLAVMKMNSELGYVPVTYSELTSDEEFWSGCKSCVNFDILMSKDRKNCLCTGMLYDPAKAEKVAERSFDREASNDSAITFVSAEVQPDISIKRVEKSGPFERFMQVLRKRDQKGNSK
jgi:hypothetical protein